MSVPETTDPTPDWSQTSTPALCCPLCGYSLRGLEQPRCPECGFVFTWAELLRGLRDTHPYLFEHHPKRNIWSFAKTYFSDSFPRRFWKSVSPAFPVRPRRLIVYWAISNLVLIGSILAPFGSNLWYAFHRPAPPASYSVFFGSGTLRSPFASRSARPFRYVPIPPPAPPSFGKCIQFALDLTGDDLFKSRPLIVTLIVLTWPWMTLIGLLVFAQSMRRAKIKKQHVLRVVIYGCDFGLIMLPLLAMEWVGHTSGEWPFIIAGVCAGITIYRVTIAYSHYLRFHLPLATVLASQIMVFLVALIVYFQAYGPF